MPRSLEDLKMLAQGGIVDTRYDDHLPLAGIVFDVQQPGTTVTIVTDGTLRPHPTAPAQIVGGNVQYVIRIQETCACGLVTRHVLSAYCRRTFDTDRFYALIEEALGTPVAA
jgi:hypothetical protein